MNKLERDFLLAAQNRAVAAGQLNALLCAVGKYWLLPKYHSGLKKGFKKNNVFNRVGEKDTNSIGLDYICTNGESSKTIIMRKKSDPSLYYKMPSDISPVDFEKQWLKHFYFLILDDWSNVKKFKLFSLKELFQKAGVKHKIGNKNNKNRLDFVFQKAKIISPKEFHLTPIDGTNNIYGVEPSFIKSIEKMWL